MVVKLILQKEQLTHYDYFVPSMWLKNQFFIFFVISRESLFKLNFFLQLETPDWNFQILPLKGKCERKKWMTLVHNLIIIHLIISAFVGLVTGLIRYLGILPVWKLYIAFFQCLTKHFILYDMLSQFQKISV